MTDVGGGCDRGGWPCTDFGVYVRTTFFKVRSPSLYPPELRALTSSFACREGPGGHCDRQTDSQAPQDSGESKIRAACWCIVGVTWESDCGAVGQETITYGCERADRQPPPATHQVSGAHRPLGRMLVFPFHRLNDYVGDRAAVGPFSAFVARG